MFADTVGERATVWIAPDAGHTEAFNQDPAAYEQRVIGFFKSTLSDHQDDRR